MLCTEVLKKDKPLNWWKSLVISLGTFLFQFAQLIQCNDQFIQCWETDRKLREQENLFSLLLYMNKN